MRHVYIRGFLAVVWLAAAILSGSIIYFILCGVFLYSAHEMWKKRRGEGDPK